MPIELYMCEVSPSCIAVILTAEHLGIKLKHKSVDLWTGENLKPEFLKINHQHTVPVINDDGFYLAESRSILGYLVNKYAPDNPIYPKDPNERAVVDRMLYFDIGTLTKTMTDFLIPELFFGKPADDEKREAYQKGLTLLEEFLGRNAYAAGDHITIADFSIISTITFSQVADVKFDEYPKISAWMKKLKAEIPSYEKVIDIPYQELKAELKKQAEEKK